MSEPVERSARGVSAAEKYAEVGENRPRCKCHEEEMIWSMDREYSRGGHWRCVVVKREREALARQTPGTYRYAEARGIGLTGAKSYLRRRKARRREYESREDILIAQLEAKLKGAA